MTTETLFCIGSTLAALVNVEGVYGFTPHVLPDARVALTGQVRRRSLSGKGRADGFVNGVLRADFMTQTQLDAFMLAQFSGYETQAVQRYMVLIDERGRYISYLGYIEKPAFTVTNSEYLRNPEFALAALTVQSVTKTSNATLTSSERYVKGNTGSGNVTLTLPAASALQVDTPITIEKIASANTLTIQRGGSDTVNGGTSSIARTANDSYYTLVSDGVSNWVTI